MLWSLLDVAESSRFAFHVLGSFDVLVDGQSVDLGGRKPAELLAILVVNANTVVTTERLVDELWGDDKPRTARKTIQVHVSRLRRSLGAGILETASRGYVLRIGPEQIDATVFERRLEEARGRIAEGDPAEAAQLLRAGLGLWRGHALAGMEDVPSVALSAARLEDLRLAAVELRVEADLACGRHQAVVGELEALVGEHPYREGFRRQLILALYRSGRQAEALAAYRAARTTMAADLGIEPGPELRQLEAAVLRQDPSLAPPGVATRAATTRRTLVLVGAIIVVLGVIGLGAALRSTDETSKAQPMAVPDALVRIDPRRDAIVQVTPVGRDPDQLAYATGSVWVVNHRDRTLTRVSDSGDVNTIGGVPYADHIAVVGDDVWVSSFDRASVARIDGKTAELVESIGIPSRHAEGLAVGGGYLWITNPSVTRGQGRETISRFDLRSRKVVSTIRVGKTPIFTTFGFGSVWVSNYDDNTISVISPGSDRAETIDVCNGPLGITAGFDSIWVVCYWDQRVVRIDPTTRREVGWVWVGSGPLSVSAGEGGVWVTNRDSRDVYRIDPETNEVVAKISVPAPASPRGVATGNGAVWVSLNECQESPCF